MRRNQIKNGQGSPVSGFNYPLILNSELGGSTRSSADLGSRSLARGGRSI